jgi:hypothetical protein
MVNVYGQRPATYRLAKMNLAMVVSHITLGTKCLYFSQDLQGIDVYYGKSAI